MSINVKRPIFSNETRRIYIEVSFSGTYLQYERYKRVRLVPSDILSSEAGAFSWVAIVLVIPDACPEKKGHPE